MICYDQHNDVGLLSIFAVLPTDVIDLVKVPAHFVVRRPRELEEANERERVCVCS